MSVSGKAFEAASQVSVLREPFLVVLATVAYPLSSHHWGSGRSFRDLLGIGALC